MTKGPQGPGGREEGARADIRPNRRRDETAGAGHYSRRRQALVAPVPSTPLGSLEAVVLDTETTGLDARTARLLEIGAIRILGEDPSPRGAFVRRVRPDVPNPPAFTAVHGIGDADVADAPAPAEVLAEVQRFVADAVVVGHSIHFDLEVAGRAGREWPEMPALDVRALARLVTATLADESLDGLCAWLGIGIERRHSAHGNAAATARVFAALVPILRRRGIRTLAEAEAACRVVERRGQLAAAGTPAGEGTGRPGRLGAGAALPARMLEHFLIGLSRSPSFPRKRESFRCPRQDPRLCGDDGHRASGSIGPEHALPRWRL